jgi:hypothetical protein
VVVKASKRGQRYIKNRMGDAGEPWGMPVLIGRWISVWPSNESAVVRLLRNDVPQDTTGSGQPRVRIV